MEIAIGIQYLHELDILHDSINPCSIKRYSGRYKVSFNQFKESKKYMDQLNDSLIKQQRSYYYSPEKYLNNGYDESSDIWSLGILFLELAIGSFISNLSSFLPCKTESFNLEKITNRIPNFIFKKMIHYMLNPISTDRIPIKLVRYYISQLDFSEISFERMPSIEKIGNTIEFSINLFNMQSY